MMDMEDFIMDDGFGVGGSSDSKAAAGRWTAEEHSLFLQGLKKYNKQWKQIAELVKTRTVVQIRTHAQKYFQKLTKMKDGKLSNKPTTLITLESMMLDSDDLKSGSRTSSISSSESVEYDDSHELSDGEGEPDDDVAPRNFVLSLSAAESPSKKRPRRSASFSKVSAVSTPRRSSRAPKRPNLNSGYYYPGFGGGDSTSARSTSPTEDWFLFPTVVTSDEGQSLDDSIVTLLERIDWSLSPSSRSHSPFMDSAASVSSNLDTVGMEIFNMLEFNEETPKSTVSASSMVVAPRPVVPARPLPVVATALAPAVVVPSSSIAVAVNNTKERLAFSNVMREFEQVFGQYKIGAYDRLPSIRTLLSMKASNITVSSFTGSLTPSHSTFCHFPLADDSTDLLLEDEALLSGPMPGSSGLLLPLTTASFGYPTSVLQPSLLPPMSYSPQQQQVSTPRRRGRPRKNSHPSLASHDSQASFTSEF